MAEGEAMGFDDFMGEDSMGDGDGDGDEENEENEDDNDRTRKQTQIQDALGSRGKQGTQGNAAADTSGGGDAGPGDLPANKEEVLDNAAQDLVESATEINKKTKIREAGREAYDEALEKAKEDPDKSEEEAEEAAEKAREEAEAKMREKLDKPGLKDRLNNVYTKLLARLLVVVAGGYLTLMMSVALLSACATPSKGDCALQCNSCKTPGSEMKCSDTCPGGKCMPLPGRCGTINQTTQRDGDTFPACCANNSTDMQGLPSSTTETSCNCGYAKDPKKCGGPDIDTVPSTWKGWTDTDTSKTCLKSNYCSQSNLDYSCSDKMRKTRTEKYCSDNIVSCASAGFQILIDQIKNIIMLIVIVIVTIVVALLVGFVDDIPGVPDGVSGACQLGVVGIGGAVLYSRVQEAASFMSFLADFF
jgi:hypothetical protein